MVVRTAEDIASELVSSSVGAGITLATAESLTAGLIAATVASVPGASAVLRGGLVVYGTDLKHTLAGVPLDLLSRQGPVDPSVAGELARGAAARCVSDIGIGVTGVAGPDSSEGHPVGEVWIGLWAQQLDNGHPRVCALDSQWHRLLDGTSGTAMDIRQAIREHTVMRALEEAVAVVAELRAG